MSNNIDHWQTKRLHNFIIPVREIYSNPRKDWIPPQPRFVDVMKSLIEISNGDGVEIEGMILTPDLLMYVGHISITGEGSSTTVYELLDEAFKKSTGELEAVLIFEGGEIVRLNVKDGKMTETEIEL